LIEVAGSLFANAAYAAAELGDAARSFRLACEGRARLIAIALRLETLDLAPEQRRYLEELRAGIREQSLLLERATGLERASVLDEIRALRAELSSLVAAAGDRWQESDPLVQAIPLLARGCVIAAPVVTELGGKLLLVTAGDQDIPVPAVIDLPELTAERLRTVIRGDEKGLPRGWLAAFAPDVPWRQRKARSAHAVEEISRELWSLLGSRLERALSDHGIPPGTRLIFMPSGGLGLLPLGLAQACANGRRLMDTYEIVTAPSLSALAGAAHETERPGECSLAAVVDPTGDLIFAPIEGALVAAHFKPEARTLLDQARATPEAVLAAFQGKTHWHLSTHAVFDFEEARRSALVMKDGARLCVDSLLAANGLGRPRLVVLSACETGLHELDRMPEEFIGLTGAFMTIGARAVLSTLWPVDDRATALLMAKFYDGHLDEGLAPAAALRSAQRWLMSATRAELIDFVLAAERQSRLGADATRKLVRSLTRVSSEAVRFFNIAGEGPAGADKSGDGPPRARDAPMRPFAHPVYWGGFVVTGL
jgi:CHAT domain-containing protein